MRNRRTWIFLACFPLLGGALAAAAQGCRDPYYIYDCNHPLFGRKDSNDQPDPCCEQDPCPGHCLNDPCPDGGDDADAETGATGSCAGDCVPLPPFDGWEGPGLLRLGPDDGTALACPDRAPVIAYQGHADPVTPDISCGACTCSASSGTCGPPPNLTASSAPCPGGLGSPSAFDGPSGWDGTCTAHDPIDASAMVRSLTAAPLAIVEAGCAPSIVPPAQDPSQLSWKTAALACRETTSPGITCHDPALTCAPAATPDFRMCIFHEGVEPCPPSYPQQHLVYSGFDDQRSCSPCACGAPAGSSCTATLGVFKDSACGVGLLDDPLSSDSPSCFDLAPAGQTLGSKSITKLAYQPGTCTPSGGQPMGSASPSGVSTFCCLAA